jgi:ribosomal protein S18 acetylase RimI-like enzyme
MQSSPGTYHNLVAEVQGRVVGLLSLVCYRTLFHQGGTALINELVVQAGQRGRGVGRLLVREAVRRARAAGMDEVEVSTESGNRAAAGFYRACGFHRRYVLLGMEFDGS